MIIGLPVHRGLARLRNNYHVISKQTVLITGASRGIESHWGTPSREGANIVIASKSIAENPKSRYTGFPRPLKWKQQAERPLL
jgi:hypothetical protein